MKDALVKYGAFSVNLADYSTEDAEHIAGRIIKNLSNSSWSSYYYDSDKVEGDVLESNRKVFAQSSTFKKYLADNGISSLDDITYTHTTYSLGSILGFKYNSPVAMRDALVKYGVFSANLDGYTPQQTEHIAGRIIAKLTTPNGGSYCLDPDKVEYDILDSNRKVFAQSSTFKKYLADNGISSLDDITIAHTTMGLGNILGFKKGNPVAMRDALIRYRVFSANLDGYTPQQTEHIANKILEKLSNHRWDSYYFDSDKVDYETLQLNRGLLLGTQTVQEFLAHEGVDLSNLTTIKGSKEAQKFFRRYFGIGRETRELSSILPIDKPAYRRINTVWNPEEEKRLEEIALQYQMQDALVEHLKSNSSQYQGEFGRSYNAIVSKMERMGLVERIGGEGTRENGIESYAFPPVIIQEFPDALGFYKNISFLLTHNNRVLFVPAFGYESPAHEQFTHVTLPINWKGTDINGYTPVEQEIIAVMQAYIMDRTQFRKSETRKDELHAPEELEAEPRILRIANNGTKQEYIQLIFRRAFLPYEKADERRTDTEIILTPYIPIYHFKHEGVTFAEARNM